MKNTLPVLAILGLLLLAACAPPAAPPAAPPSAQPPAAEPTPPPAAQPSFEVLPGAKIIPSTQKLYGITVDDGRARSAYGRRLTDEFQLEMQAGDVLKISVSYGEPAIRVRGKDVDAEVKPGENVRIESKEAGEFKLTVEAGGQETDVLRLFIGMAAPPAPPEPAAAPPPPAAPQEEFTIEADDNGFYPEDISVGPNQQVRITFKVREQNVYFGGLDIRSAVFNTGAIKPGESKTVEFTSTQSFGFTSYWPSSNVEKADGRVIVRLV